MSDDLRPSTLPPRSRSLSTRTRPLPARHPPARAARPPAGRARRVERAGSHRRIYALVGFAVCALGLVACVLGVFTVHSVQVVGSGLPADVMAEAAGVTGQNIFTVQSDEVVRRLDAVSAVDVRRVELQFPDRVVIYAQLRQPAVVWQSPRGGVLIDRYGQVIGPAGHSQLPTVSGPQPPSADQVAAVGYIERLVPSAPDGAIAGLSVDPGSGLTIQGRSGWQAVIGSGSAQVLVTRVAILESLLSKIAQHGRRLAYVDLRHKGTYYRLR